jgi:hypothetical protein
MSGNSTLARDVQDFDVLGPLQSGAQAINANRLAIGEKYADRIHKDALPSHSLGRSNGYEGNPLGAIIRAGRTS